MRAQYAERRVAESQRRMEAIASTRVPSTTSSGKPSRLDSMRSSLGLSRKQQDAPPSGYKL